MFILVLSKYFSFKGYSMHRKVICQLFFTLKRKSNMLRAKIYLGVFLHEQMYIRCSTYPG